MTLAPASFIFESMTCLECGSADIAYYHGGKTAVCRPCRNARIRENNERKRNGLAPIPRTWRGKTAEERFWAKVRRSPVGCWEWQASKDEWGYGIFCLGDRMHHASRCAWLFVFSEIPDGLIICHTCDNPGCVRPSHLFLGTDKDNHADMVRKGRDDGPSARNRKKTHCKRGHEFNAGNTRIERYGSRTCRTCERAKHERLATNKRAM